eukprot:CAMPEP_0168591192 /NCGR_PEP_ID=MMETSP0420-20121227/6994_1 /TAXON_ID=498008 /ORGANISM="Pessonella sp." /LENGTH=63 /DNA_ID=CAMNT_0008626949 /DNA_START=151 /DNA_END=342 /DNA_ORIENTATION=+
MVIMNVVEDSDCLFEMKFGDAIEESTVCNISGVIIDDFDDDEDDDCVVVEDNGFNNNDVVVVE